MSNAQPTTQRNIAYKGFCQQIIDARIRPGQFVSQRELMEMLGMTLAAVRELIPRLEAAGLVVVAPQRGIQIASVDMKLIRNAWQIRTMIEREAAQHFCTTAKKPELEVMILAHERILERALSSEPDATLEKDAQDVDWGLHDHMVNAIGNEILSEIYQVNSLHVRLIRFDADAMRPTQIVPAMQEHLAFLQALYQGNPDEAVARMMSHIDNSKARVLRVMDDMSR